MITLSNILCCVKAELNKSFILLAGCFLHTWGWMGLIYVLTGCRGSMCSLGNWKTYKCWKLNKKSMRAQGGVGMGKWLERTSAWLEFNSVITLCWPRLGEHHWFDKNLFLINHFSMWADYIHFFLYQTPRCCKVNIWKHMQRYILWP